MSRRSVPAIAAAVTLAAAALTATPANAATAHRDTFTNREWQLRVPGTSTSVGSLTVTRDGIVTGTDGCNRFSGTAAVNLDRATVRFDQVRWTLRACSTVGEAARVQMKASSTIQDVLARGTVSWAVSGSTLTAMSASGKITRWSTMSPVRTTSDTVTGTDWHLADAPAIAGVRDSLTKAAWFVIRDGQVSGSDGCNNIMGEAVVDPATSTITFPSTFSTTRMLCTQDTEQDQIDADAVSATLHSTLNGTVHYALDGARLVITAADGTRVTFVR